MKIVFILMAGVVESLALVDEKYVFASFPRAKRYASSTRAMTDVTIFSAATFFFSFVLAAVAFFFSSRSITAASALAIEANKLIISVESE